MRILDKITSKYQADAFHKMVALLKDPTAWKKPVALLLVVIELFSCAVFNTPVKPMGEKLDLSDYELVFEDEFEGDTLNTDVWYYRRPGRREEREGYNSAEQVRLENGNMILTGEYREDGEYGPGWYAAMVALKELHKQGYYEIRCICNDDFNFWSAFWIQARTRSPYTAEGSQGGTQAVELDIFESLEAARPLPSGHNSIRQTIHCAGVYDDSDKLCSNTLGYFKGNNIYKEYNTYGLEWTEDEYIFYVNGVETVRSNYGKGTCQNPEEVIVSLELPKVVLKANKNFKTEYIVDYVRIYDKKPVNA